jgi:predicted permease
MTPPTRPSAPERLLAALTPPAERDELIADLRAERLARAIREGDWAARRWVWRQVASSLPALIGRTVWRGRTGFESRANRDRPGGPPMESWLVDLRFSLRRLRRRPLYAALAILTLALGVAGAAGIAGVVRHLLLDPLPYAEEERLGLFWGVYDWSEREFLSLRPEFPGFSGVAAYRQLDVTLERPMSATRLVSGLATSAELFDVLGTAPQLGRGFRKGDDVIGAESVAVISHGLWQELGGDPAVVGQPLTLDGEPRTVVGVMPRGFWFPAPDVRVWVARRLDPADGSGNYALVGRLARGVEFDALRSHLARTTARLAEQFRYPVEWDKTKNAAVTPLRDALVGPLRPALWATAAAMVLILLIACANVAALTLGQLHRRSVELAARIALGAERKRLAQQIATEALVIGGAAALVGGALAAAGFRVLVMALPLGAWAEDARIDGALFAGAFVAALLASLLVSLPLLVSLWRGDLSALATSRSGGLGARGGRIENALVIGEVALAVLISVGTALLARSVAKLYDIDPGVRTGGLAVLDVALPGDAGLGDRRRLVGELVAELGALPGSAAAAATHKLPLRGSGSSSGIRIVGRQGDGEETTTYFRIVTPGYLETMGYPLLAGRTLVAADREVAVSRDSGEAPVVINAALAAKYFPGEDPLGRVLAGGFGARERIVGVVGDATEAGLADPRAPARYWLTDHVPFGLDSVSFVIRAAPGLDPVALLEPARAAVTRLAPAAAVREATTMERVRDQAVGPARQVMQLLSLLAALAVALGAVGVYGVLAHFVGRRHRDWAIRMALGFEPAHVVSLVVVRGVKLVAAGVAAGWLLALALSRLLASFLFEVDPADPVALIAAGGVLLLVGLAAAVVPAWRASRTHPAVLLREA